MTDFGGKTSIFSHPVYIFLRKFSLQDFRGGSVLQIPSKITCKDRHQKKQCSPQTGDRAKPANRRGSAMYL
ncbi:hypothetical protein D9J29_16810 [Escherichia coli]|nr:hypothetical protein [Escherichia coli]